jgi:glycosyltransferase involved in cell wall biosynthesis
MIRQVVLEALKLGVPVFVVDDGSTDQSRSRIQDIHGIRILEHSRNRGKGAALRTGFAAAAEVADWAATIDADGQHDPAELSRMFHAAPVEYRPIVLGTRENMGNREVPWTSRFGREFSNFWVWIAGGKKVADSQNGFRIYPLPEILDLDVVSRRYQFEVEVLVKAMWSNIPIVEHNISVNYCPGERRITHYRPFIDFMRNSAVFNRLIWQRVMKTIFIK